MKKYKLGEIATIISGVSYNTKDIIGDGIRILRGGNIQENDLKLEDNDVFLPYSYKNANNQIQWGDTIIVASTGSSITLGKVATCFADLPNTQIGAFLRIIRPKDKKWAMLISMWLHSSTFKDYILKQAKGTSINNIRNDYLEEFTILCSENEINEISGLYLNIANKIALNRAINHNLEAMAKQLYDYWFVQFDFPNENGKPYKSNGGKMVWNEKLKREIPEGWNVAKVKDIALTYSGGTPTSTNRDYYEGGDIPWINSGELNSPIITSTSSYITEIGLNNSSAKLYPQNTVLVALYGATAGKVSLLSFEACSNQAVCGVMPNKSIQTTYIRYYLSSLYEHFIALSSGSARDNISQDTIKNTTLPIPQHDILRNYSDIVNPIVNKIIANQHELELLTKQRNVLLPLLMNGQASVNYDLPND